MIFGVETQIAGPTTSGGPSDVARMNFLTGDYAVGGTAITAAALISNPSYITVNGLEVGNAGHTVAPSIISSAFKNYFDLCSFTAVIDFQTLSDSQRSVLLELAEWATGASVQASSWFGDGQVTDSNNNDGGRSAKDTSNGTFAFGHHKIALTRTNAKLRISLDGFPIGTDGSFGNLLVHLPDPSDTGASYDGGATHVSFTHFNNYHLGGINVDDFNGAGTPGGPVIIKSLYFYNPVSDSLLPSMSA